jgi:hypothetical protein
MDGLDFLVFVWAVLGVLAAVLFPVLAAAVKRDFPPAVAEGGMPPWARKYLTLFVYAVVSAIIVLMIYMSLNPDKEIDAVTAFLLGFGAEATIEKFRNGVK